MRRQVREEQAALRPDPSTCIDGELLSKMKYTRQVVKEVLRFRPPAPMVPQARIVSGLTLHTNTASFSIKSEIG